MQKQFYKYYSFNISYLQNVYECLKNSSLYLSKLTSFSDSSEYTLNENCFTGLKEVIEEYNKFDKKIFKIFCCTEDENNEYLIEKYCKGFGFIVNYNSSIMKPFSVCKNVNYVENKDDFLSKKYESKVKEIRNDYDIEYNSGIEKSHSNFINRLEKMFLKFKIDIVFTKNRIKNEESFFKENEYRLFLEHEEKTNYVISKKEKNVKKIIIIITLNVFSNEYINQKINEILMIAKKIKCEVEIRKIFKKSNNSSKERNFVNDVSNKQKWLNAYYFIEAKKCIDSLLFLIQHQGEIQNSLKYDFIQSKISYFVLNLTYISDYYFSKQEKPKIIKKDWIKNHYELKYIYNLRDKNYAHKDKDFMSDEYKDLESMINDFINILKFYYETFRDKIIPDVITINLVIYDKVLYRLIHCLNNENEEKYMKEILKRRNGIFEKVFSINQNFHPLNKNFNVFNNADENKNKILNIGEYATILEEGLTVEEKAQNQQDFCIKNNFLFDTNMWYK